MFFNTKYEGLLTNTGAEYAPEADTVEWANSASNAIGRLVHHIAFAQEVGVEFDLSKLVGLLSTGVPVTEEELQTVFDPSVVADNWSVQHYTSAEVLAGSINEIITGMSNEGVHVADRGDFQASLESAITSAMNQDGAE
jgi:hypothetical protein